MSKRTWSHDSKMWRLAVGAWTILLFLLIILDFIANNAYHEIVEPVAAIYTALLAIYSADKEFERWMAYYSRSHPGEVYVVLWTVIILVILFLDFIFHKSYVMPSEIIATYIVVLGILAITRRSREYFEEWKKKCESPLKK